VFNVQSENPAENAAMHQERGSKSGWNWNRSANEVGAIVTIPRSCRANADAVHIFEDSSGVTLNTALFNYYMLNQVRRFLLRKCEIALNSI
jgi:hypothetical protein